MSDELRDVEEMKEFLKELGDVKVLVAEVNGKMDRVMDSTNDTKEAVSNLNATVEDVKKVSNNADNRSIENAKDIGEIKGTMSKFTIAFVMLTGGFVFQILYFLLTFGIK